MSENPSDEVTIRYTTDQAIGDGILFDLSTDSYRRSLLDQKHRSQPFRFDPGRIVVSRGVRALFPRRDFPSGVTDLDFVFTTVLPFLERHLRADWGTAEDAEANDRNLQAGRGRLLSNYGPDRHPKQICITTDLGTTMPGVTIIQLAEEY